MTNINRRYRLSGIAKAGALAGAMALASSAVAGGQFTTQYDDVKVRLEVTGLDPGGLLFFNMAATGLRPRRPALGRDRRRR